LILRQNIRRRVVRTATGGRRTLQRGVTNSRGLVPNVCFLLQSPIWHTRDFLPLFALAADQLGGFGGTLDMPLCVVTEAVHFRDLVAQEMS